LVLVLVGTGRLVKIFLDLRFTLHLTVYTSRLTLKINAIDLFLLDIKVSRC